MERVKNIYVFLLLSCLPFLVWAQQDEVDDLIRLAQEEQVSSSSPGAPLAENAALQQEKTSSRLK